MLIMIMMKRIIAWQLVAGALVLVLPKPGVRRHAAHCLSLERRRVAAGSCAMCPLAKRRRLAADCVRSQWLCS